MALFSVDGITKEIERQFECVDGLRGPVCQTGDSYVVIGSQHPGLPTIPGTIDEGAVREHAFDEETAASMALASFQAYHAWWSEVQSDGEKPILYWRIKPELNGFKVNGKFKCSIYLRLALSDKPVIYRTLNEYDRAHRGRRLSIAERRDVLSVVAA